MNGTAHLGRPSEATAYKVVVSHDGEVWVADVPQLEGAHTQAGNLTRLDEAIREVIALVEDLPEGAESSLVIEYEYEGLDDVASAAAIVGRCRAELEAVQALLSSHTTTLVQALGERGWSVRDVAPLLSISPGRVSQLRAGVVMDAGDLQGVLHDVDLLAECRVADVPSLWWPRFAKASIVHVIGTGGVGAMVAHTDIDREHAALDRLEPSHPDTP